MSTISWVIYSLFAGLALIPVIKLDEVRTNKQYRVLWILSLLVFVWAILIGFNLTAENSFVLYYSRLLTYPIVFGISYAIFATFQMYIKHRTSKLFHFVALSFFFLDVLVVLTNSTHLWVLKISYDPNLTREVFNEVSRGWFFLVHTVVCYIILLLGFGRMLIYLAKKEKQAEDVFPFPMILISLVLGIGLNITHLFFIHFPIDPTFLFVVIVTFLLYTIIYKRDFNVNLILSSRKFLFSKMREMYVILDPERQVIEYSSNLMERFGHLGFREGDSVKEFFRKLKFESICYHDITEIKSIPYDSKRYYLHIEDQEYRIDRFRSKGALILLYDETLTVKMMHEIDEIKSHDLMTNVYNRSYFEENRDKYEKEHASMGLIMFDVDGLKLFNDYLGHREGDKLLIKFSNILLKLNQVYDDLIPVRFGGDEFVLVAKKADQKKMDDIMTRIIEGSTHQNKLENISFSYGMVIRNHREPLHSMLKRADEKLYEMKESRIDYKRELVCDLEIEANQVPRKKKN